MIFLCGRGYAELFNRRYCYYYSFDRFTEKYAWYLNHFFFCRNPLLLLLIELTDGCCGFTAMIAGSYYAAAEAPPGMLASFNGIISAAMLAAGASLDTRWKEKRHLRLHHSWRYDFFSFAGRAIGTSIGSKLIGMYGIRTTYLLGGYLAGGTAVIYFLINHFFLRKIREERHRMREKG